MSADFSLAPYPGLRPFRAEEADIYFGRETQTDALLDRLARTRLLAVVGPSGCGKSSLVRAGMIASLQTGFMAAAGADWRIADLRPGDRPMARLARALRQAAPAAEAKEMAEAEALPLIEAALRRGPLGLVEWLRDVGLPPATNLLLLVDQFEEIFRYREKGDRDEADAFVALLLASAAQRELPIYIVITMRSDFLGDCALFSGLPEAINDSQYLTPRLTREQCRLAITGPAKVFGGAVDPALVNRLLNDFGPDPDQLPLLQHALMRMWDRARQRPRTAAQGDMVTIGIADYEDTGGLTRAMSDHADEVLAELSPPGRAVAEVMFRRLTERGIGRRDTRAPARLSEVAAVAGVAADAVYAVVEAFRRPDRSFVTPPVGIALGPDTLLDIGHESLIRQWRSLGEWVDRETRSAALYQRLATTARLWVANEAALWRNPDLERAMKWQQEEQPTAAWAARYGSGSDFAQAIAFLHRSEASWREEQRSALEAARRQQEQEIALQTQAVAQQKLRAENEALRSRKRLLSALAVLLPLAIGAAAWAGWQMSVAVKQAGIAAAATQRAEHEANRVRTLLERLTNSEAIKRAFLAEDGEAISRYASATPSGDGIAFGARGATLDWKTGSGTSLYRYEIYPLPNALRGPLRSATRMSYFMNHPSFDQKVINAGPGNGFTGVYTGWGCLSKVYVLVEYADADRLPEVYWYDMCTKVAEQ